MTDKYVRMMMKLIDIYQSSNFINFSHGRSLLTYCVMRSEEPSRTWSIVHRDSIFYVENGDTSICMGEGEHIEYLPYDRLCKEVSMDCPEIIPVLSDFLDIDKIDMIPSFLKNLGYNDLDIYIITRNIQYPITLYLYGIALSIINREIPPGVPSIPRPRDGIWWRTDMIVLTQS